MDPPVKLVGAANERRRSVNRLYTEIPTGALVDNVVYNRLGTVPVALTDGNLFDDPSLVLSSRIETVTNNCPSTVCKICVGL